MGAPAFFFSALGSPTLFTLISTSKTPQFVPGKVFLGGVSHDSDHATLETYCGQWGEVADVHVMAGKGYAFVTFASPSYAQAFLEQRTHSIDGRSVEVKAAVPKEQGGGGRLTPKMFVGGITDAIGDDEFRSYFSEFGSITDATILRNPDGSVRGYGFVTFDDEVSVEKCLVQQHSIAGKLVECKRATPRDNQQQPQQFFGGGPGDGFGGRGGGPGGGRGRGRGGPPMMMGGGQMMAPGGMMGGGMPMMGMMGQPGELEI